MKAHVIVQSLGICLLVWTSFWDLPVTGAAGPPVHLAIGQKAYRIHDQADNPTPAVTQLLPTEWIGPAQLIPTELETFKVQLVRAQSRSVDSFNTRSAIGGQPFPWIDGGRLREVDEFFEFHLSRGPMLVNNLRRRDSTVSKVTSWVAEN